MISHKCRLISWLIWAPRTPMHFFHKTFPGTTDETSTWHRSFTALAFLLLDCQKLTYVKQQDVALPFCCIMLCNIKSTVLHCNIQHYIWDTGSSPNTENIYPFSSFLWPIGIMQSATDCFYLEHPSPCGAVQGLFP